MILAESVQVMKTITNFYSNFSVNEPMVKEWHSVLKDYDFNMVLNNLKNHVVNSKYPPSIADLVKQSMHKSNAYIQMTENTFTKKQDEAKRLVEQYEKSGYLDI